MPAEPPHHAVSADDLRRFVETVVAHGAALYRDLPWRHDRDPYAVLVSEVMLQQTQVTRVERYHAEWLQSFPTLEALAAAPLEPVLRAWRGLGYNRRALALKRLAEKVVDDHRASGADGAAALPRDERSLRELPGVGPATAAGVRAFAFGEVSAYLETNVRAVFLHELFADRDAVSDREILPLVEEAARLADLLGVESRTWNFALLDYGAHLKKTVPNPSRRSSHHARQRPFEGSTRQKRAWLLRAVLDQPGRTLDEYVADLIAAEAQAGRVLPSAGEAYAIADSLVAEGMLVRDGERLGIA